jgi:hypothetical protein
VKLLPSTRLAAVCLLAGGALLGSACGSDDDSSSGDSTTTTTTTTTTAEAKDGTMQVTSAGYDASFDITNCSSSGETDLNLTAVADAATAKIHTYGGNSSISIDGSSGAEAVSLTGKITSLQVGDAGDFEASGTFGGTNFADEEFSVTGSCAGVDSAAAAATTTTEAGAKEVASAASGDLTTWQTDLDIVGCYVGQVDGRNGPKTESAVKAFQAASGLTPDGRIGPRTQAALSEAAAAKKQVCVSTTGDESATTVTKVMKVSSANYDKSFSIGSCKSADESSATVTAEADNLTATLKVSGGTGTLAISGSTESDGITLNGDVTSLEVGDTGDFTASGTFGAPNNAGEAFTVTGNCA